MPLPRPSSLAALVVVAGLNAATAQAAAISRRPQPSPAEVAKRAACEKVWSAQKVRHGSHASFVAACVAKG
jgi:hypothetical protein